MQSYQAARNLFSFMSFCASVLIALGAIVAFLAGGAVSTGQFIPSPSIVHVILAAVPGGLLALIGFFGLSFVQMGRTSVDTAEYSQQSLQVSRQQLELSQQLLEQGRTTAASFASLKLQRPAAAAETTPAQTDEGASYASQPQNTAAAVTSNATPAAITAATVGTASPTKAITHEEQIPLTPISTDIVYKDGKYLVGEKPFRSKDEAQEYQQSLSPVAAT